MDQRSLRQLLEGVRTGRCSVDAAVEALRALPYEDLGFARIDHHRELRRGRAESVYCPGKQTGQIVAIVERLSAASQVVLATRATPEVFAAIQAVLPEARYHEAARLVVVGQTGRGPDPGRALVITAGTSDLAVAEEAAVTLEAYGHEVKRLYDVGVAGIHRLLGAVETLRWAEVVIVVAGMDGALPSVVGGLAAQPVIAVPTSVGYGASFGGLAALLAMLNSCAPGVAVVNIDNGFGAARMADAILRVAAARRAVAAGEGGKAECG